MEKFYDEIYEPYRTDVKYPLILIGVIIGLILAIVLLFVLACEPTDYSEYGCCWKCKARTTWYEPQPGIAEMETTVTYADSLYCNCSDEQIHRLETLYTKTDTVDGVKRETVFQCRK